MAVCVPQTLVDDSACLECGLSEQQLLAVIAYLLCQIEQGGGTGGGITLASFFQAGNYAGGEPDWTPTGDVGIAIDTSTTPGTEWLYYGGSWH